MFRLISIHLWFHNADFKWKLNKILKINLNWLCSCTAGFKMSGTQCINENECLWQPCQNGGRCIDLNPPRKYECKCPFGYTGMNCELELLASGVLTPSRDFVIAIIICVSTLICKYFLFRCFVCNIFYVLYFWFIRFLIHLCIAFSLHWRKQNHSFRWSLVYCDENDEKRLKALASFFTLKTTIQKTM